MSPKKIPKLPRQTVWMDERGRVVVPEYLRDDCGLKVPGWVLIVDFLSTAVGFHLLFRDSEVQ